MVLTGCANTLVSASFEPKSINEVRFGLAAAPSFDCSKVQQGSIEELICKDEGKPVVPDSPYPVTFYRKDDLTIVTFDNDERYEIPDALVFGG
jgi:hypothetical protein